MNALMQRLRRGPRPLLWDGGVGTALISRGLDLQREPPEAWLLERPAEVQAVHAEFAAAGADVVQTNSFGLLRHMALGAYDWDFRKLAFTSVALAEAGAKSRPGTAAMVVASLGPIGIGAGSKSQHQQAPAKEPQFLAERLAAWFAAAGAQAVHLETCCDPTELRQILAGVRAGAPHLPVFVSMTVSVGQSGLETPLGVPLSRMLHELAAEPPDAVGVNCSLPARRMPPALAALSQWAQEQARNTPLPILIQPQVDQPAPDCKRPPVAETPERFAKDLLDLIRGPTPPAAVGGCCGARGAHIAALGAALTIAGLENDGNDESCAI